MWVEPNMLYTSISAFVWRDWVEAELRHLDHFLGTGDVFVDIGANIGLFTLKAAKLVGPSGRVLAVEPGRETAVRLTKNLALNRYHHIEHLPVALSDREGVALLHHVMLGGDSQGFSLLDYGEGKVATEEVQCRPLDGVVAQFGLTRLDCIKIDVEGAEPLVLKGGAETLSKLRPIIIFEVNTVAVRDDDTARTAAWDVLAGFGYRFYRMVEGTLRRQAELSRDFGNVVAIHPEGVQPRRAERMAPC
jgi:FkbM family methyltransferase